jgi:hypothetical protein
MAETLRKSLNEANKKSNKNKEYSNNIQFGFLALILKNSIENTLNKTGLS